jgi:hypothetical protein
MAEAVAGRALFTPTLAPLPSLVAGIFLAVVSSRDNRVHEFWSWGSSYSL